MGSVPNRVIIYRTCSQIRVCCRIMGCYRRGLPSTAHLATPLTRRASMSMGSFPNRVSTCSATRSSSLSEALAFLIHSPRIFRPLLLCVKTVRASPRLSSRICKQRMRFGQNAKE